MRCLEIGGSLSLRANDLSQWFLPDFDMVDSGDLLDLKMRQNNRIANSMNKWNQNLNQTEPWTESK